MHSIDVSVIIPAWRAERTVALAVRSALEQAGASVEVVVADDASPDGTAGAALSSGDARVRCLRLPVNGGPAAARNAAAAAARGAWIAVLDADDEMLPGRLAGLLRAAAEGGLDVVADNMWVRTGPARRLFIEEELDGAVEASGLAAYARRNRLFGRRLGDGYLKPMFSAAMLRRHGLAYDAATRIGEDFLLVADAMAHGARYGRVRSAGYVYTAAEGSISHRLSPADAAAMADADRRFLARHAARLAPDEARAMRAHLASLRDGASFVAMVDGLKSGRLGAAARHAAARPAALRHFAMPVRARIARARAGRAAPPA